MSAPKVYTIGWICAVTTEYLAAQEFLDEEYGRPEYVSPSDNNDYTLGKVGRHYIVIAVLPQGRYGLSSATSVAKDMLRSFPHVRIGLMVGIGGGAPSPRHDIRLGDIVVGTPCGGNGGVLQYDFGKTIQDQSFQMTGYLNQPPSVFLTALNGIKTEHERKGHQLDEAVNRILEKTPRLQRGYKRPDSNSDRLYKSRVIHPPHDDLSCSTTCRDDPSSLILRSERTEYEDNPAIHYGLIASANQLMKDALVRDNLAAEKDVLCFEMEAAGLMNQFPCLVIRGICDYADSHKNNEWRGYAAMVAAAYAKQLLLRMPESKVEAENTIANQLSGLPKVAVEHRDIAKRQLQLQQELVVGKLSEAESKCHQLFRLTSSQKDVTYEWYKDRVEERIEGTCMWFLQHEHFQMWLKQDSGPLLVSADPGCGKSVLAKYLIDHALPGPATICYFFFKDQDQNTARQALCALLHQLFQMKPSLIKHAMTQFREDGLGLTNSTKSLWKVLRNAVQDPQAGPIIIVLDALDECAESEFVDLVRNVERQFRNNPSDYGKLKYLLTSRPYDQIVSKFHGLLAAFPNIRIPGEEESEAISKEVNHVITHRVNQLSSKKSLSHDVKSCLEKKLLAVTHRTYLWVYLVFDYLEETDFKKTEKGVESAIAILPGSVNEAYEQILNESKSKELPMVRKALSIILAASRPLTLSEMNIAVNIDHTTQSFHDLDLEKEKDFVLRLRSWCGLFVSIYHGKIYFIHQTAREFLLEDLASPTTVPSKLRWHHSITTRQAHTVLAELCVRYLNFFNSEVSLPTDGADGEDGHYISIHAFLSYSAKTWGAHFREAGIIDDAAIVPFALRNTIEHFTDLIVASYFGLNAVVKLLLEKGAQLEARDSHYGRTALIWATTERHEAVVKLLLEKGTDVESRDRMHGQTPLSWAVALGREAIARLLLQRGADIHAADKRGRTALFQATMKGQETLVKLLLEMGADIEATDNYSQTPLFGAAALGYEAITRLLLHRGAYIHATDSWGRTALLLAADEGRETIVGLLLDNGAHIDAASETGTTPLARAAALGREAVVSLLLERGAQIESKDINGETPLWLAEGHEAVVKLLRNKGARERPLIKVLQMYGYDGWTRCHVSTFLRWRDTLYKAFRGN